MTPQGLIHIEGYGLSGYFWPLELTNIPNPPGSEIQVIVQMEPRRHHIMSDLLQVNISSLSHYNSLPKGGCPSSGHACSS